MQYITLAIAIIGSVIAVITFFDNKKIKSNKDIAKEQYEKGKLDSTLATIMGKLDKIEAKLDGFENETKKIVKEEMDNHIAIYHKTN